MTDEFHTERDDIKSNRDLHIIHKWLVIMFLKPGRDLSLGVLP